MKDDKLGRRVDRYKVEAHRNERAGLFFTEA